MERYSLSRKNIIDELRPFNLGGDGKHLYDPTTVMPILDKLNKAKGKQDVKLKKEKALYAPLQIIETYLKLDFVVELNSQTLCFYVQIHQFLAEECF